MNKNNSRPMLLACTLCFSKTIVMPYSKYAHYVCLWSLHCDVDQLNMIPMILISQSQILIVNVRIPDSYHLPKNLLDFKLLCNVPLVMIMHKVTKTLSPVITEYSKEGQPLWNGSLIFKVHCFEHPSCIKVF